MQRDHGNCVSYLRLGFFPRRSYYLPEPIINAVVITTFSYYRPDCVGGLFESSLRPMNNNIRNPFTAKPTRNWY